MAWQWNERAAAGCAHGYLYGDCPLACLACGHPCNAHEGDGPCGAFECPCQAWVEDDAPDEA